MKSTTAIFLRRINDYKKANQSKSFAKPHSRFNHERSTPFQVYGGLLVKLMQKESRSGKEKLYYVSHHRPIEYFAVEVLQQIGINTPKIRLVTYEGSSCTAIASQIIENYIPIYCVRQDLKYTTPVTQLSAIQELRSRYSLDIEKQIITDLKENQNFKISGNLFAADIAALLVNDADFGPNAFNCGLVRRGNRFFAVAIDKDRAQFNGLSFLWSAKAVQYVLKDALFQKRNLDQELVIINQINKALTPDANGVCDFDRIFINPRVRATPDLMDEGAAIYCRNLKIPLYIVFDDASS